MPRVSAFADEVSQDPREQMDVLEANGIRYVELRGAYGLNVLKWSPPQCKDLRGILNDRGVQAACVASPIGKIRLDEDYRQHFDEFKRAVDLAEFFGARYIRIFSYYPPQGQDVAGYRAEVLDRLAEKVAYVAGRDVILALENESNLFGAVPERYVYLLSALYSPQFVGAFDPANFVNMDVPAVFRTCWLPSRRLIGYLHIKDFKYGEKAHAVPAGQGDGCIPQMLRDAADMGYDGFMALEPHLGVAGHSTGQTSAEAFKMAADALRQICQGVGWQV